MLKRSNWKHARRWISALAALLSLAAAPVAARAAGSANLDLRATFQGITFVYNLTATSGPAAGYITLNWTAPGGNGFTPPLHYDVRTSTVANMMNDVDFNAAPLLSVFSTATIPSPLPYGSTQSMLVNGLTPGVTYYFAIRAYDTSVSTKTGAWVRDTGRNFNVNNFAVPFGNVPFTVQGLTGVSGFKSAILCWQDLTPAQKGATFQNYDLYKSTVFPPNFSSLVLTSSTCYTDTAVLVGSTYYYMVTGKFTSFETLPSSTVAVYVHSGPPLPPVGVGIAVASNTATLSWQPVYIYQNGIPFSISTAANAGELTSYQILRASAPILAPWTQLVSVSSSTLSWTDPAAPAPAYYAVTAANLTDVSRPSVIRSMPDRSAYVVMYDGYSMLVIPAAAADAALGAGAPNTMSAYDIYASSRPQDIPGNPSQQVGQVLKSVQIDSLQGGLNASSSIPVLNALATLQLHYGTSGSLISPSSIRGAAVTPPSATSPRTAVPTGLVGATPDNAAVYWYNGNKWMQMYGKLDAMNQYFILKTSYLGRYQLRSVERAGGFNVDVSGLSNRLLTPNGDGKNDTVVIVFDNPRDSAVSGKIYDLKGGLVANMTQGPIANSLLWDGKSSGAVVPGGVYIYQISAEGKTFNGTIVVVK